MPRKLKRLPPSAVSQAVPPAPEPIPTPQGEPPPRPKIGRPSNAEKAAREEAARQASLMKPEDTVFLTATFLKVLGWALRGDDPTDAEIEAVNGPACAVLNKYPGTTKWAPECMLGLALLGVATEMRRRGKERREREKVEREARRALDSGAEGVGQVSPGPGLPSASFGQA